jgi:hypothetical protein
MVRQQAALLLVNMTSQSMPSESVELEQNLWQGPIVTDTESKVWNLWSYFVRKLDFFDSYVAETC